MSTTAWSDAVLSPEETRKRKRMAVLTTAAALFNEKGFDRTSLDDIAKALNVSKRTLYYYVKNKEEILFEINRLALKTTDRLVEMAADKSQPARQRLENFFSAYARLIVTDIGRILVVIGFQNLSEQSAKELNRNRAVLDAVIRQVIEDGIAEGTIKPTDPALLTAALFGAFNWVCWWNPDGTAPGVDEITGNYLESFLDGVGVG